MSGTLYARLGGYDAIAAVADDLLPRLQSDARLARFWQHRGEDGLRREKQLLIDFLCASAGGPLYYVGRDMKTSHRGMGIEWRGLERVCKPPQRDAGQICSARRGALASARLHRQFASGHRRVGSTVVLRRHP